MSVHQSPQEMHNLVAKHIAEVRFKRPNNEFYAGHFFPTWKISTNVPVRQMPVEHRWMGVLYPDVVIVDTAKCNAPMVIAEVETAETLIQATVDDKWFYDYDCCIWLHLYVPEGHAMKAAELCLEASTSKRVLAPKGIRTYGLDDNGKIRITIT
tara:strand:+ start:61 stop:522 length:462 start_codon:yes stop_codon:yes gene_type:complete